MKIAVIGAGISGITAAYLLARKHEVTLFEKNERLGGHTNTVDVENETGEKIPVDTGFIVLNDCNYGILHNLFSQWKVDVRWSDMSFSFYDQNKDYYYSGTDIFGLFPKLKMLFSKDHLFLLWEIFRFGKLALEIINNKHLKYKDLDVSYTLGCFVRDYKISQSLLDNYLLPMGSAIWSVPTSQILDFPALSFFSFFKNHGLLEFTKRPRWQTVVGGSSTYLKKFEKLYSGVIELNSSAQIVQRFDDRVVIKFLEGHEFVCDQVVFACHADQVLSILEKPSVDEEMCLSHWHYQKNLVVLHTDTSILPPNRNCWAAWNYHANVGSNAVLTYYMNRLQGIKSSKDYLVSLNCEEQIAATKVIKKFEYHHPVYTKEAVLVQSKLKDLQGCSRTYFCGSYFGNGFHEDGARSGAQVALLHGIAI